jgi:small subunit ribosomal protein S4
VNGKKVSIPSFLVKPGDTIKLSEKSHNIDKIKESLEVASRRGVPRWLELEMDTFSGKVLSLPAREEITMPIREQLVVELYSR